MIVVFLGASVGLEMGAYSVMEGAGTVEVCVVSSLELDKTVMVELTTEDGSAQSKSLYHYLGIDQFLRVVSVLQVTLTMTL